MASTSYTKKTWKGRLGTDLDKYTIGPVDLNGRQKITPYTGGVTQQGDPLSAGNLNDLEGRIDSAFESVEGAISSEATTRGNADNALDAEITKIKNGTTTVEKAKKDEDGNNIKATYATKTALSEEETARETADTNEQNARIAKDNDLQSQIVNVNGEVETLNAIVGGEAEVDHIDPAEGQSIMAQSRLISYPNLLPNGSFGRVGARAVAWNQQIKNGNFNGTTNWDNITGTSYETISASNNEMTVSVVSTSVANGISQAIDILAGHTYLVCAEFYPSSATTVKISSQGWLTQTLTANSWNRITYVKSVTTALSRLHFYVDNGGVLVAGSSVKIRNVMLFDLTAMNMASLTAEQFRALFPASYYPNDTGHIYDLNPSGFRIRGINLWDEELEEGVISSTTGEDSPSNSNIRSKNHFEVSPSKTYYFMSPNIVYIRQYDENKNFIATGNTTAKNSTFTTEPNCHFLKFFVISDYGTTYYHDIQIADNSLPDAIKTNYHPNEAQTVYTPQIADGHYVNESVYDYVENVTEDGIVKGKKHKRVGVVDSGTLNWERMPSGSVLGFYVFEAVIAGKAGGKYNLLTAFYLNDDKGGGYSSLSDKGIVGRANSAIVYIRDDSYNTASAFKTAMSGVPLYYELAEEEITYVEPLRSFDISDYSTVEPITPQTELVNRIDVPFSVLTKSNNGVIQQITTNKENIDKHTSILSNHNKRLRNLEHKSGDYEEMIYPDEDYGMDNVPPGVEEYAVIEGLRAVSRVENNLVQNGNFASSDGWSTYNYQVSEVAVANNEAEQTVKYVPDASYQLYVRRPTEYNAVIGHKYLNVVEVYSPKQMYFDVTNNDNGLVTPTLVPANKWTQIATITEAQRTTRYFSACPSTNSLSDVAVGDKYKYRNAFIRDLNVYFGGTIPSDADTIAEIQQNYPHLLLPSEYGTRIVDSSYSGVRAYPANILEPMTQTTPNGTYSDGTYTNNTRLGDSAWTGKIDVSDIGQVTIGYDSCNGEFRYGLSNNDVSGSGNIVAECPTNISSASVTVNTTGFKFLYMYFRAYTAGTTATLAKARVNVGSTALPYSAYHAPSTLSLTFTGKSAGSVADTCEPNVEVEGVAKKRETQRIGQVDLGTLDWRKYGQSFFYAQVTTKKIGSPVVCDRYAYGGIKGDSEMDGVATGIYVGFTTQEIKIKDDSLIGMTSSEFRAAMSGVMCNYELATPVVTLSDPILDPLVKVEPNGTIEAIQSQETKIDGSMVVGYMYQ